MDKTGGEPTGGSTDKSARKKIPHTYFGLNPSTAVSRQKFLGLLAANFEASLAEKKLRQAEELFDTGQYEAAQKIFKSLADNQGNSGLLAERARYMQAECRFQRGHFPEACDTYHKVLLDFPTGAYRAHCCARMFEICDYWLDDFRAELERRKDEKGVLRWKPSWPDPRDRTRPMIDQEGRTLEALQWVHTHDLSGPVADKALFWCGYVSYVRGNFGEANRIFSQFLEMHKDSPLRPEAIVIAILAKNNLLPAGAMGIGP